MEVKDKKIGFVLTGSYCTFSKTIPKIKELVKKGSEVIPIMSYNAYNLDTKFGKAKDFIDKIEEITGKKIIHTIQEAEPIGPKKLTDIIVVCPCSGNTMSKLAMDIIDTPATMAVNAPPFCWQIRLRKIIYYLHSRYKKFFFIFLYSSF